MFISDAQVADFQATGVLLLRGLFRDWVAPLADGVAAVMQNPSPLERSYRPADGSAPFFQDYCNWRRIPSFHGFVLHSPAGAVAARLMQSPIARFFHDHVLVKDAGNSTVTPWHHDQPYYCVRGLQSVSFWTPLDPVSRDVTLECVAGSHRWSRIGFSPTRFDGTPLFADGAFDVMPDIDARRDEFDIRGWAMEPGDAVAFDFRTVHGAPGNRSERSRRVFSTRWVGADARFALVGARGSPPFPDLALRDGEPFDAPEFPVVYGR